MRNCLHCGKEFEEKDENQKFCKPTHAKNVQNKRRKRRKDIRKSTFEMRNLKLLHDRTPSDSDINWEKIKELRQKV